MLPVKNLVKHRKMVLVLLIVVCIIIWSYCMQSKLLNETPTSRQLSSLHAKPEHPAAIFRRKVLPTHHASIPNLHLMLNKSMNDMHGFRRQAHRCSFPPGNKPTLFESKYEADVSRIKFAEAEKGVFRNFTGRVQLLTQRANELLGELRTAHNNLGNSSIKIPSPSLSHPPSAGKNGSRPRRTEGGFSRSESGRFGVNIGSHLYFPGGHWIPITCKPKWKVAIIVPYRNRSENLNTFLRNLVPFLLQQEIEFGIFVGEQGPREVMNRGLMRNIGYQMARYSGTAWDCYVFHDVDYVPVNVTNYYGCDGFPKHFAVNLEEFNYSNPFLMDFGGVVGLTAQQVEAINGYSNMYWGWGGEDDDIFRRLTFGRYNVTRSGEGYYRSLKHTKKSRKEICRERFCLGDFATKRIDTDGLSAIQYHTNGTSFALASLYTKITVDVGKEKWNYGFVPCQLARKFGFNFGKSLHQWHLANMRRRASESAADREARENRRDVFVFVCVLAYVIIASCICDCVQRTTVPRRGRRNKRYYVKKKTLLMP